MDEHFFAHYVSVACEIDGTCLKINFGDYEINLQKMLTNQKEFTNTLIKKFSNVIDIIEKKKLPKASFLVDKVIVEHIDQEPFINKGFVGLGKMTEVALTSEDTKNEDLACLTFFNWIYYHEVDCYMQLSFEFCEGKEWLNILIPC